MNSPSSLVFDPQRNCWLSFNPPTRVFSSSTVADVIPTLYKVQDVVAREGSWSIGWLSYEAAPAFDPGLEVREGSEIPLIWFGQYDAPMLLDELPKPNAVSSFEWQALMNESEYAAAFSSVREHISRGDTYQVNLSFRMQAQGVGDAYAMFYSMVSQQAGRYSFFLDAGRFAVCSASPELFFELSAGAVVCRPMKGTAKRGSAESCDEANIRALTASEKEKAENVMIVDMVRNDLSRIATDGSVRVSSLFEVEKFPRVFQMVSEVRASTAAPLTEILRATFPSASITGAPKQSTMQIITKCENSPRGVYTGSLGIVTPEDRAWFNVAIRTAVVDQLANVAEYGVGSGIVWDSHSAHEYNECVLKAHVVQPVRERPGLFETLLWDSEKGYWLLDHHVERLTHSARYLGYPCSSMEVTRRLLAAVVSNELCKNRLRVRLVLDPSGAMTTDISPLPVISSPYRVSLAREPIASTDARLFHKSTDRSIYDTAIPVVAGVDDVLLWNERGEVTESRIANLIVSLGGILYTPPVSSGLLPGCLRRDLVERGEVIEQIITIEELKGAESVYLANSLRGTWPVEVIYRSDSHERGQEVSASCG
jgi:para-aminobenzoate synthetase/4-amino-4-deoxychorismate lyase